MSLSEEQKKKIEADANRIAAAKKNKEVKPVGRVFTEVKSSAGQLQPLVHVLAKEMIKKIEDRDADLSEFYDENLVKEMESFEVIPPLSVENAVAKHNYDQNINGPENANNQMSVKSVTKKELIEQYPEELGKVFEFQKKVMENTSRPESVVLKTKNEEAENLTPQKMLSDIMKGWRKENNLTQAEAARKLGLTEVYYHTIEHGKQKLISKSFQKIIDVLGLKINISK